jgi:glyoxylase-like metal-dependent hydrolase (beta-lactamase superfamily II)
MITEEILDFGDIRGLRVGGSLIGPPLMTVIYYYLDGILIDTGSYYARKSIKNFIENNKVTMAFLTHYHEDHSGNAAFLVNSGVQVFGHNETVKALARHNRLKPYEHILFGKLEPAIINILPEKIETNRFILTPIHTPGHSHDHTVYYEPNQGWLFSGDLFLSPKIKYWRKDEDLLATINSLDLVLQLDFQSLFCGHNPKLNNPKNFLTAKKNQLLTLLGKVDALISKGLCQNEVIRTLCKGKEAHIAKWFTLGDASYKNMIVSAIDVVKSSQEIN